MELLHETYFEDQEGKKVHRVYRGKTPDGRLKDGITLLEPSQWYIDNVLEPTRPDTEKFHKILEEGKKVSKRISQLGETRTADPERIATEDEIFNGLTSTVATKELDQIVAVLEWIGNKTFKQVENYIENNITNPKTKAFLKILSKVVLANSKLIRILAARELPPEV